MDKGYGPLGLAHPHLDDSRTVAGGAAGRRRASILAEERIAGAVGAVSAGMRDVVACGGEDAARVAVGRHVAAQAEATRRLGALSALQTVGIAVGGWLPVILILAAGSWLVGLGASTGAIVGAITYVLQGVLPALQSLVRGLGATGMWLLVSLRRVAEAAPPRPPRPPDDPARRRRAAATWPSSG